MHTDEACRAFGFLLSIGAHRGAAQVAFNALLQLQAEARAARKVWTPDGPLPLPANTNEPPSMGPIIA